MKETLLKLKEYNKTISKLTCSDLERSLIKEINDRDYFYGFSMNKEYPDHVQTFLKQNHHFKGLYKHNSEKLCFYLQEITRFTCNKNLIRMDARSENFSYHSRNIHTALSSFYFFTALELDIKKAVYGEYRQFPIHINFAPIIATELLLDNAEVIQYCKDVLVSENNTAVLTRDLICAIEQSKNKELQDLLLQVFKAAKLQEGLRQSIIETCDEFDIDFFYTMIPLIKEENLLRFSSIQRGVLTWIGIGYVEVEEKKVRMILDFISDFIQNEESRKNALSSMHAIEVYVALYCLGIKDVNKAIYEAIALLESDKRHIIATALIYLRQTRQFNPLQHLDLIEKYQDDEWISALFVSEIVRKDFKKQKVSKDDAQRLYTYLIQKAGSMKTQEKYSSQGFEWFYIELYKANLINTMLDLLKYIYSQENVNTYLPFVSSLYSQTRVEEFMDAYFKYASLDIKKKFMLKEIISSNETLSKKIYEAYLKLKLDEKDIIDLESRLKTKKSYARAYIVKIIAKQKKEIVQNSFSRLQVSSLKTMQEASLELKQNAPDYFEEEIQKRIEIIGADKGFSIYTPKQEYPYSYSSKLTVKTKGLLKKTSYLDLNFIQPLSKEEILGYFKLWNKRIELHKEDEYEVRGEYRQVGGNNFYPLNYNEKTLNAVPLGNLWKKYFEEDHLHTNVIFQLKLQIDATGINFDSFMNQDIKLFSLDDKELNDLPYIRHIRVIFRHYFYEHKEALQDYVCQFMELMNHYTRYKQYRKKDYFKNEIIQSISSLQFFQQMLAMIDVENLNDEQFKKIFPLYYETYIYFHLKCREDAQGKYNIPLLWVARAVVLKILPIEALYEMILDTHTVKPATSNMYGGTRKHRLFDAYRDAYYKGRGIYGKPDFTVDDDREDVKCLRNTLDTIVNTLLPMESSRLNEETAISDHVSNLKVILGVKHLILAMQMLEGEDIRRQSYGKDRNTIFTNVIRHCYPIENEDNITLLKNANFKEKRLVEVAMLSPQWIDTIAKVLGWDGFKEACYYFIAHMKDYDYDHKKAEIAQYTDLDPTDLNDGAFDIDWCKNIYALLGEKRFAIVYNAAKFLCDNAFHTRARKYADAALNKVEKEEFKAQVEKSRNKDALNAYCVVPMKDDQDLLERYLFVQKFLKQSKKFGAQRQASEARTSQIAFMNLARNSRFENITRLSWMMESENIKQYIHLLEPQKVEDIEVHIEIDENGKNEIITTKNGKKLKSIPSKLSKNEMILYIKDVHKKWSEQFKRSKAMLEEAMENRTYFTLEEIEAIQQNPIVSPMLKKLVLISKDTTGFYKEGKLVSPSTTYELTDSVRIAHPFDLYKQNVWHEYQAYIFENKITQPFKQVFRELYLKLEDELGKNHTKRYSGYQIQIQKTKGALKNRKWNASYESGLEKICYKDNITAHLYAEADWFSPSDIEAPSIDYVHFTNRKDYKPVLIEDIDNILFSELMRDVDLAVSVAYVGGVDPITSFSTIELRKTIVEYTCKLMKLDNVSCSDHFANIKGKHNDYSVHLGSGMVYQSGGASIHILPVHSGQRGKLYLPFLDEDPNCATILSKIILLAEDTKIKDPSILSQIITKKEH